MEDYIYRELSTCSHSIPACPECKDLARYNGGDIPRDPWVWLKAKGNSGDPIYARHSDMAQKKSEKPLGVYIMGIKVSEIKQVN